MLLISAAIVIVAVGLAVGLYFGLLNTDDETQLVKGKVGVIATNGIECASIGGYVFFHRKRNNNHPTLAYVKFTAISLKRMGM